MLRFVAVPVYPLILERAGRDGGDGPGRAGLAAEPAGRGPALHPLLQGLLCPHQVPHRTLHPRQQAHRRHQGQTSPYLGLQFLLHDKGDIFLSQ
jgi:hypothetical protein